MEKVDNSFKDAAEAKVKKAKQMLNDSMNNDEMKEIIKLGLSTD